MKATPVYRRTTLVDKVLGTVKTSLLEGAILVIAVLFIFLGNVRAGLIVAAAIPLSMLFAFDLMMRAGIAGSLMSLGAIDFGLVVDGSVITIENSVRRLAEDGGRTDRITVIRRAAIENHFGWLVLELEGDPDRIQAAKVYLQDQGIEISTAEGDIVAG